MSADQPQIPEPMEKDPKPSPQDLPSPELIDATLNPRPIDWPAPELIHEDEQPDTGDKQSDLDVPGGKGLVFRH